METAESPYFEIPFFESLSSPARVQILYMLKDKKLTASNIAKHLGISLQGTRKHLDNLEKNSLIKTDHDGHMSLSTLASIVVAQFPMFRFLSRFASFVDSHKIDVLPQEFLYRIGEVENASHMHGTFPVYERAKKEFGRAREFVSVSLVELPIQGYEHSIQRAKEGIKVSLLYGTNTYFPKDFDKVRKQNANTIRKLASKGLFKERQFEDTIQVTLQITENEAMLGLPKMHETLRAPDSCLIGQDQHIIKWCYDLFDYYWQKSIPFEQK